MKDIELRKSFETQFEKLNTLSGINYIKTNNVHYWNRNKKFSTPSDNRFFRCTFLPSKPSKIGMYNCNQERYTGIFQIDVCVPIGVGTDEIETKCNWIYKLFAVGTTFDNIEVTDCYKANEEVENDYYKVIIRIEFDADVINE